MGEHNAAMTTRLKELMEKRGISAASLSRASGISPSTLNKLIHGHRKMAAHWADQLAPFFELGPEEFFRPVGSSTWEALLPMPELNRRAARIDAATLAARNPDKVFGGTDIPIVKSTPKDSRVFYLEKNTVVNKIRRPPALEFAKNVYGFFVVVDNMHPKFDLGDLLLIDPDRPPGRGGYSLIFREIDSMVLECELGFVGTDVDDQKRYAFDYSKKRNSQAGLALEDRPGTDAYRVLTTAEILGV